MPFAGFHGPDLVIILAIALLIFGPKKLPEMGASIGKSIKEFKKGMAELTEPKAESPAAYEAVSSKEAISANYTAPAEPVVASYTAAEPVVESYETPASFESEVRESEVNAQ
jgi:sec-independent protein translocase protein TatA